MKAKLLSAVIMLSMLASCFVEVRKASDITLVKLEYSDSQMYASVKIDATLPAGDDKVSSAIRDSILHLLHSDINRGFVLADSTEIPERQAAGKDWLNLASVYGQECLERLSNINEATYKEMQSAGVMDETAPRSVIPWIYEIKIDTIAEALSDSYIVFNSKNYIFTGGAHGGVIGRGPMTFKVEDGSIFKDFIIDGSCEKMQPLLREGLVSYFNERGMETDDTNLDQMLLLNKAMIPLPGYDLYPTAEGLAFVYQQYEIAPYAAGMPTFTIAYDKIRSYLTAEAVKLLGLE